MARKRARGYWGGQTAKQLGGVNIEITVPVIEGLEMDEAKLFQKVATALASDVRKSLKAGRQPDGSSLPQPQPRKKGEAPGKPLNRTGKLISDIKARDGFVSPSTSSRPELGKRARSSFGLLKILISGVFHKKGKLEGAASKARGPIDPLGALDPKLGDRVNKAANKVMSKMAIKLKAKGSTKV